MITRKLTAFKKKKKMSPYDITPSANPRIPVNLEFFLTNDYHVEKVKKKVVQTCTDGLIGDGTIKIVKTMPKDREIGERIEYIPEQLYIPKKTGIDAFTQVENDELFNFDREVEPIVQVLITKTIEQGLLELEEEIELQNMQKFKMDYVRRVLSKNEADWNKIVDVESDKIMHLRTNISKLETTQIREEQLSKKIASKQMSFNYLRDLETNILDNLESRGRYRAPPQDKFKNGLMDFITKEVVAFLDEEFQIEHDTQDLFPDVESRLMSKRKAKEAKRSVAIQEKQKLINYEAGDIRKIFVYWENENQVRPLVFSVFNGLILEYKFDVIL